MSIFGLPFDSCGLPTSPYPSPSLFHFSLPLSFPPLSFTSPSLSPPSPTPFLSPPPPPPQLLLSYANQLKGQNVTPPNGSHRTASGGTPAP